MTVNDAISEVLAACGPVSLCVKREECVYYHHDLAPQETRRQDRFVVTITCGDFDMSRMRYDRSASGYGDTLAEATRKAIAKFRNPKLAEVA
jgi:hypothetical protein